MATLQDLFPGRLGRLDLARVILKLRMPELADMAMSDELPQELSVKLRAALSQVKKG